MRGFPFTSHCLFVITDNAALTHLLISSDFKTGGWPLFQGLFFLYNEAEGV